MKPFSIQHFLCSRMSNQCRGIIMTTWKHGCSRQARFLAPLALVITGQMNWHCEACSQDVQSLGDAHWAKGPIVCAMSFEPAWKRGARAESFHCDEFILTELLSRTIFEQA